LEEFLSGLLVFSFSTVKFLTGIAASLGFQQGLIPSYVSTVGGGILGVFIFTFFGELLNKWFLKLFPNRSKKTYTSWNRFVVKIRRNFGLPGIALLTPILSIPVGIFLSLSLSKDKLRISVLMFLSFLVWSSIIFIPYYLFDLNIQDLIKSWF
tara:strand:+ start:1333 stop:1791 length:459 start_codon:yes stop_codon:yes gene_type:complete